MYIKQLSVFVANKPGRLADVTEILEKSNIDIKALSIADTTDYGIVRLIVSDPDLAADALRKENIMINVADVIGIRVPNKPGGFATAVRALSKADISLEYAYAFITPDALNAGVIIRVEDNDAAAEALRKEGIELLSQKEVFG